jgi:hypothetical protein
MVVNFSHEEIELHKATILGVAEQVSAALVAEINDTVSRDSSSKSKSRRTVSSVATDPVFDEYLSDKLGHLNTEEMAVMEPMLKKYRHVFHQEGSNEFKGTDLAEHEIVTGDARPIRKAQYRLPFALIKEIVNRAPKRRASTNFVFVKTTHLPSEGALEARGPPR